MSLQNLGAPPHELTRSMAARAVGELAAQSGLMLAHFEHRVALPLPVHWQPAGRPDLGTVPGWTAGILAESKYQSFGVDRRIGSFHPGQRSKWAAHELCHGLVGFAWRPGASAFWHATAARMAELLPVVLWYFLDEHGLRRCPDHKGPLFGLYCRACEAAAAQGPVEPTGDWLQKGRQFIEAELAAISQSRRFGRVIPHRYATLDLSSDGLAYAAAHGGRLQSSEFERFVALFCGPGSGRHATLADLEDRIWAVFDHIVQGKTTAPLVGDRALWVAQDVAWRLLTIRSETEGQAAAVLDGLVEGLASDRSEVGMNRAIEGYMSLAEEWTLPDPEDVFAVGYALGDLGRSVRQCAQGIASALPDTWGALGSDGHQVVADWLATDEPVRRPIGRRFAGWLASHHPALADHARFEAAVAHALPCDAQNLTLGTGARRDAEWKVAQGVELLDAPEPLAVFRAADGEVEAVRLDPDTFSCLLNGDIGSLSSVVLEELASYGLIRPLAWAEDAVLSTE